jgi:HK97 family phage prohead protease
MTEKIIRKSFQTVSKAVDIEQGIYEAMITTEDEDRTGDVVRASGALINNYMANPVVLLSHDYSGLPVAKNLELSLMPNHGIKAMFQFPPRGLSARADEVHNLWGAEFMNTTSIGFIPKKTAQRKNDKGEVIGMEYLEWELLEFSIVSVPANAMATRMSMDEVETKVGRVLSASNERKLKAAADSINEVLAQLAPEQESYEPAEMKPYENEHACRKIDPGMCDKFRSMERDHEGKMYRVIMGHMKSSGDWVDQAYRYPKDTWTAEQAKAHCSSHDGDFEAARDEGKDLPCCGDIEEKDLQTTDNPGVETPVIENHEVETDITPTPNDASDTELDKRIIKQLDKLLMEIFQ